MSTRLLSRSAVTSAADLRGSARRVATDRIVRAALFAAAAFSIAISALIVWTLFKEAWTFLSGLIDESGIGALVDSGSRPGWYPRNGRFDLATIVSGTLIVSMISVLVAARSDWARRSTSASTPARGHGGC